MFGTGTEKLNSLLHLMNTCFDVNSMQLKPRKFIRRTEPVFIHIEDDRTGMSVETLHRAFIDNLHYIQGKAEAWATPHDYYMALAYIVRDRLIHRWIRTQQTYFEKEQEGVKFVCYLSDLARI
jgi:glycogen phosphorylase